MIKAIRTVGLITVVLAVWLSRAEAGLVTLSGTNQVQDTYLRGDNNAGGTTPANNLGGSTVLFVGRIADGATNTNLANTLMRFDFSGLSALSGQTVTNTTLRLYNNNNAGQTADVTVGIYEVAATNGDWVEGTALGTVQTGSSDWRYKIQNTGNWAGGQNGCGVAGTDHTTNLVGSATVIDGSAGYVDFTLDAAVVQKWIDHPEQNYGIILTVPGAAQGQAAYFNSSEAASNVPELMLETTTKATLRLFVITGSTP